MWDVVHTAIRPVGGAFVAVAAMGDASPGADAAAALLGGSVAMVSHLTKAGTRAAANTSPEPFSNWALSIGEDIFAVSIVYLALEHPYIALAVVAVALVLIAVFAAVLIRAIRRWWSGHGELVADRSSA
jgi:hypothetical protein